MSYTFLTITAFTQHMITHNTLLNIQRLPHLLDEYYEIKDPSIIQIADHAFMMYASIGNSRHQQWLVGCFEANNPHGPWQEVEPVTFEHLSGPQLCAPAVTYENVDGQPIWTMYIQTACFEENGVIAVATSTDGHHFVGQPQPLATKEQIVESPAPIVGVYDVAVSEIKQNQEELLCMVYSGYRRIGCGDIFMTTKRKGEETWTTPECLLSQEAVPFHNRPDYEHFEWGLEGAKIVQLADDCFLMIGVCFLPKPQQYLGTRQRVFFAAASSISGPFVPVGLPFVPQENEWKTGENGHPDTLIIDDTLHVMYQERFGEGHPWHLRSAEFELPKLELFLRKALHQQTEVEATPAATIATYNNEQHDFDYKQYHFAYATA